MIGVDIHKQREIESRQRILAQSSGGLYKNPYTGEKQFILPTLKGGWEPTELQEMSKNVQLKWVDNTIKNAEEQIFQIDTTQKISFSEIITLAGDFYGENGQIVLKKSNEKEKEKKFMKSYDNLFNNKNAAQGLKELLDLIDKQVEQQQDYNRVTDGRYSHLAFNGSDQYDEAAREVYTIGHNLAIQAAKKEKSEKQLLIAYQIEGFAQNYLCKLFSSGHIRNPRLQVEQYIIDSGLSKLPGNPLAKFYANNLAYMQHEEDGKMGVHFQNQNGDQWFGLGDNFLNDSKNAENLKMIKQTLQQSSDEIFQAFQGELKESQMDKYTPRVDAKKSNIPLLHYSNDKLWIRDDTMNEHSTDYSYCMDVFQLSKALLDISKTGFYDIKVVDFFIDLFSPITKTTKACCGSAPKPKKNRTENRANWVTPKDKTSYFDVEKQLDKFMKDPLKILPSSIVFRDKEKSQKAEEKSLDNLQNHQENNKIQVEKEKQEKAKIEPSNSSQVKQEETKQKEKDVKMENPEEDQPTIPEKYVNQQEGVKQQQSKELKQNQKTEIDQNQTRSIDPDHGDENWDNQLQFEQIQISNNNKQREVVGTENGNEQKGNNDKVTKTC